MTKRWTWKRDDFGRWGDQIVSLQDGDREVMCSRSNAHGGHWIEIDEEDAKHILAALNWREALPQAIEKRRAEKKAAGQ